MRLAQPAPPVVVGFYRMLFAALAMAVWRWVRRTPLRLGGRPALLAVAAGTCFGTDIAMWQTSILATTVATATLLVNVTPVHVGIYAFLARGQRPSRGFVVGTALALAGSFVLAGAPGGGARDLHGALLALGASLFYAAYLVMMADARGELDVFSALFLMTTSAACVLALASVARGDPLRGFPDASWAVIAAAAVVSQLLGVMGIIFSLRYLPPTLASVALLLQPVAAALLAWWILAEPMSVPQLAGGALVLAGIGLASRRSTRP